MNKQFKEITLEAGNGITFKTTETPRGLVIQAIRLTSKAERFGDYTKPPIPEGYFYVKGEWNTGYVIADKKRNHFVWVPVGALPPSGTLENEIFIEKFGRRNYCDDYFSNSEYHEEMTDELQNQFKSVQKYGGFYISRYAISKSEENKPVSVKDAIPWTIITFNNAVEEAKKLGQGNVKSHLVYGAEYDSVLAYIKMSGTISEEIIKDSTNLGNYQKPKNNPYPCNVAKTGSRKEWYLNNIADLAGNIKEWTQEKDGKILSCVARGGSFYNYGSRKPMAYREGIGDENMSFEDVGFRVALYIE